MARRTEDSRGGGAFERFATRVGDLDSPFYDEERERDVWNEASAVAFQLLLWSSPLVAAVALWVGGAGVLGPIALMMVPWAVSAGVALAYAHRHGVDPANDRAFSPGRMAAWAGVMAVLGSGVWRASQQLQPDSAVERLARGVAEGAGVGLVVGGLLGALVVVWLRSRQS